MSQGNKLLLGFLAFFPIVYLVGFVLYMLVMVGAMFRDLNDPDPSAMLWFFSSFFLIFGLHMLAVLVTIVQFVVYLVLALQNPRLVGDQRLIWIVVILLGGMLAAPAYWYLQIWKQPPEAAAAL